MHYNVRDGCFYTRIDTQDAFDECIDRGKEALLKKGTKIGKCIMQEDTQVTLVSCLMDHDYPSSCEDSIIDLFRSCKHPEGEHIVYEKRDGEKVYVTNTLPLQEVKMRKGKHTKKPPKDEDIDIKDEEGTKDVQEEKGGMPFESVLMGNASDVISLGEIEEK